jgi:hypothetical protein
VGVCVWVCVCGCVCVGVCVWVCVCGCVCPVVQNVGLEVLSYPVALVVKSHAKHC